MNIFEDLIDELKEENLLEATVTENLKAADAANKSTEKPDVLPLRKNPEIPHLEIPSIQTTTLENFNVAAIENNSETTQTYQQNQPVESVEPIDQVEFFRKRANDEVLCLQMVEHVFAGIARQQEKPAPKVYDDLAVKKSLHNFLRVSGDPQSPEHAEAEFLLRQETENWYAALSHIDRQISVSHLRYYCEMAKPVLSAQALISLARFYRNSPYSESVRAKFDLVVTRLFSKDLYNKKRELTSEKDSLIKHLSSLYDEWESVSLYTSEEDEAEVLLTALKFEDFINEAESAGNFEELIRHDFFNRLRSFKQNTNEQFFTPLITAIAVESNARIGNKYIDLLEQEKENGNIEKLENTYGFLHDQIISDALCKSLELVVILRTKFSAPEPHVIKPVEVEPEKIVKVREVSVKEKQKQKQKPVAPKQVQKGVNKWLLGATFLAVIISGSLFLWSRGNSSGTDEKVSQDIKKVNLEKSVLNEYVRDARIGNNTFFAIVQPNWENISQTEKEDVLKRILQVSQEKGFKDVRLINAEGKTVASTVSGAIDIRK